MARIDDKFDLEDRSHQKFQCALVVEHDQSFPVDVVTGLPDSGTATPPRRS